MKEKTLNGTVDDEEAEIRVVFDEEQGYITLVLDDCNETEVKFDWHDIEQLFTGLKEIAELEEDDDEG